MKSKKIFIFIGGIVLTSCSNTERMPLPEHMSTCVAYGNSQIIGNAEYYPYKLYNGADTVNLLFRWRGDTLTAIDANNPDNCKSQKAFPFFVKTMNARDFYNYSDVSTKGCSYCPNTLNVTVDSMKINTNDTIWYFQHYSNPITIKDFNSTTDLPVSSKLACYYAYSSHDGIIQFQCSYTKGESALCLPYSITGKIP